MDISFANNRLKKQMENARAMDKAYGERAKPLRRRLQVLASAACLADVPAHPPDRRHLLTGNRAGQFAVMLTGNWRLVFEPDHDPLPVLSDGGIDIGAVTAICIIEVTDYHGR